MKQLLSALFILISSSCFATRFWVGTTSTAYNNANNWASTSGGAGGAGVPTATDSVVLDLNSNTRSCNVSTGGMLAKAITITSGFTQTFTVNSGITVSGSVNYGTGTWTLAGTSTMTINASGTITTNGRTVTHGITIASGVTSYTLGDALICGPLSLNPATSATFTFTGAYNITCTSFTFASSSTSTVTLSGNVTTSGLVSNSAGSNVVLNGGTVTGSAGLSVVNGVSGTTNFVITGGTISTGSAGGSIQNNLTFSNVVFSSANTISYRGGALVCAGGTNTVTGTTLAITGTATLDVSAVTWNNVTVSGTTPTITLSSPLNVGGTLTLSSSTTFSGNYFTAYAFSTVTAGLSHTLTTGANMVTNSLTITGTAASRIALTGNIYLAQGATQDVSFVNATSVDSGGYQTIWAYKSTLSSTTNWNSLPTQPITITTTSCGG